VSHSVSIVSTMPTLHNLPPRTAICWYDGSCSCSNQEHNRRITTPPPPLLIRSKLVRLLMQQKTPHRTNLQSEKRRRWENKVIMKKIPITLILYSKKLSMQSIDVVLAAMLYGINKSNKKSWYYQVTKKLRMTRHHQNVYV
jgi:hypothetical protein